LGAEVCEEAAWGKGEFLCAGRRREQVSGNGRFSLCWGPSGAQDSGDHGEESGSDGDKTGRDNGLKTELRVTHFGRDDAGRRLQGGGALTMRSNVFLRGEM